jgi:hypothetical protein
MRCTQHASSRLWGAALHRKKCLCVEVTQDEGLEVAGRIRGEFGDEVHWQHGDMFGGGYSKGPKLESEGLQVSVPGELINSWSS